MPHDPIQQIRAGLLRLAARDRAWETFGAEAHEYRLCPTLSEAEVSAFEAAHGVALPPLYRRFITELGNGGPGPCYGLFPLGMWDGSGDGLEPWGSLAVGDLRRDFPHVDGWNLPEDDLNPPDFNDREAEVAFFDRLDEIYYDTMWIDGSIPIGDQGCAHRFLLVVTGECRGTIWLDERAGYAGIRPLLDARGQTMSFVDWYLEWIQSALDGLA